MPLIIRYPARMPAAAKSGGATSLVPYFTREPRCLPAFGDLEGHLASVRTNKAKLIRDLRTNREEFYDLLHDPRERVNVDSPANPKAQKLRTLLETWRSHSGGGGASLQVRLPPDIAASLRSLGYLQ